MDFYWGMELYPRLFGFDIKHYISCRVSMTAWPLLLITYALADVRALHAAHTAPVPSSCPDPRPLPL
jgi:hypothetical protein